MKTTFKLKDLHIPQRKLEALADALVHTSGFRDPKSPVYAARNPGDLRAFQPNHVRDAEGRRVFPSELDGLQALFWDLAYKLSGQSVAHLAPDAPLSALAAAYKQPETAAIAWARFLTHALQQDVKARTEIQFFLREDV